MNCELWSWNGLVSFLFQHAAELYGIFVKSVAEGSAAAVDGRLRVNDQIIEVKQTGLQCLQWTPFFSISKKNNAISHYQKYHNTLCFPLQNFALMEDRVYFFTVLDLRMIMIVEALSTLILKLILFSYTIVLYNYLLLMS